MKRHGTPPRKCVTCGRRVSKFSIRRCWDGKERCATCLRAPTFERLTLLSRTEPAA